jgi:hypothetical protein
MSTFFTQLIRLGLVEDRDLQPQRVLQFDYSDQQTTDKLAYEDEARLIARLQLLLVQHHSLPRPDEL